MLMIMKGILFFKIKCIFLFYKCCLFYVTTFAFLLIDIFAVAFKQFIVAAGCCFSLPLLPVWRLLDLDESYCCWRLMHRYHVVDFG